MRDLHNSIYPKRAISPVAAGTDNTPLVSQILDMQGFEAAELLINIGANTDADATFTVLMEHGDASNLSDAVAVPDAQLLGTEALASFQFDDDNEQRKIGYVGEKRYLRATITPAKLRHYSGINFPADLKPFREGLIKSGLKQNKTARNDPSWPMIRGLMREFVALGKRADYAPAPCRFEFCRRNVFLAMGLELCFGLRKNEVRQVRWEWFSQDTYGPVLRGDAMVKNGSGELRLTPLDPFWRIFNRIVDANGWRKTTGLVLEGDTISHTRDYPFAHVGAIVRRCGWTTQKTNHALRDLSASLITTKFGAQKAQWWARHSSVTTTEAHYSRFVDQRAALTNENVLPWLRFAKK